MTATATGSGQNDWPQRSAQSFLQGSLPQMVLVTTQVSRRHKSIPARSSPATTTMMYPPLCLEEICPRSVSFMTYRMQAQTNEECVAPCILLLKTGMLCCDWG